MYVVRLYIQHYSQGNIFYFIVFFQLTIVSQFRLRSILLFCINHCHMILKWCHNRVKLSQVSTNDFPLALRI